MISSVQIGLALSVLLSLGCEARKAVDETSPAPIEAASPAKVIQTSRFGEEVPSGPATVLASILGDPTAFADKEVIVEGDVKRACSKKGCWMEIASADAKDEACRVTFKDYGFFVPTDSPGKRARLVGQVSIKTLSRAHTEHLEAEGAHFARKNPDGTAVEVQIVARGVELR